MDLNAAHTVLSQLANICTYLGGFSLVFLGAIITMAGEKSRAAQLVIIASALASCCFVLSAVGWGILQLNAVVPVGEVDSRELLEILFGTRHKLFSMLYLVGQFSLFLCIGASGYLHSHRVGYVTMTIGVMGFLVMGYVLMPYVTFN